MTSSQRWVLFDCSDNTKNIHVIQPNLYLANAIPCAQKGDFGQFNSNIKDIKCGLHFALHYPLTMIKLFHVDIIILL